MASPNGARADIVQNWGSSGEYSGQISTNVLYKVSKKKKKHIKVQYIEFDTSQEPGIIAPVVNPPL